MPSITLKNIPSDLYERLKQSADANRRSLNSEIITCIERGIRVRRVDPEDLLARSRQLRRRTGTIRLRIVSSKPPRERAADDRRRHEFDRRVPGS